MPGEASEIVEALAAAHRVLVIGGLAVIAHGHPRTTETADIWLAPLEDEGAWCDVVRNCLSGRSAAYFFDVSRQTRIEFSALEETIERAGMIRIGGLDRYLDIFLEPHLLEPEDFDAAWEATSLYLGKAKVMDESFLIATKLETGRTRDADDVSYLEKKIRAEDGERLRGCSFDEAEKIFSRYADHETAIAALENPDPGVREIGVVVLRELAESNNPFAVEALKKLDGG